MIPRDIVLWAGLAFAVILPELASSWWMKPAETGSGGARAYPVFRPPAPGVSFRLLSSAYEEVRPQLFCSGGWMGNLGDGKGPEIRLAWFEWDDTSPVSTLEAFKHLPEQCMGSAGMSFSGVYSPRIWGEEGMRLVFDSTRFLPPRGGETVFVFKAVWVDGWEGADLRRGVLDGATGESLRTLRFNAARHRFRPPRTRVLMAAVVGFPTEELAWNWFREESLGSLQWKVEDLPAAR